MTYYEELGVPATASAAEIRRAYRLAARLLHPDGQHDPQLKAFAERQMQRLGEISSALLDPARRRQYDDSLAMADRGVPQYPIALPEPRGSSFKPLVWYWNWILWAIAGCAAIVAWQLAAPDPPVETGDARPAALVSQQESAKPKEDPLAPPPSPRINRRKKFASAKPIRSLGRLGGVRKKQVAAAGSMPAPAEVPNPAPVPPPATSVSNASEARLSPPPLRAAAASASDFAGRWLFSPQAGDVADHATYPATYVEFVLAGADDALEGDYRARYRILDRAVSPDVKFHVSGAAAGKSASLLWTSNAGAHGKAMLDLRSPDVMQIRWWTTKFSGPEGLASGSAVLIRKHEK